MLTPYEFGRQTGRLQARINREEVCEALIKELGKMLAYEANEITEFAEGYKNGFTEAKNCRQIVQEGTDAWLASADDDVPPWLPNAAELEADEAELEAREINYPWPTRGVEFGTVDGMINSSTWKSYLQGKFDR